MDERTKRTNWIWRIIEFLALVVLAYYAGPLFLQGGIDLLMTTDFAILLAVCIVIIIMAEYSMRMKGKAHRRKKGKWYKSLSAIKRPPLAWNPPMIWKRSAEEERRESKKALASDFEDLDRLEFERFVIRLLNKMGYDASAAPKRGAVLGGYPANIIAKREGAVIAVKTKSAHEGIVEEKDVNMLVRSRKKYNADKVMIISAAAVSSAAKGAAKQKSVELWDDERLRKMAKDHLA